MASTPDSTLRRLTQTNPHAPMMIAGSAGLAVALGFMLGAFGQIPINDYMIGRMARSEMRGSVYGARYVVSFVALAAALPLIAWVHGTWGFDMLFRILAGAAALIRLITRDGERILHVQGTATADDVCLAERNQRGMDVKTAAFHAGLGGEHDLIPAVANSAPDQLFVLTEPVHIGGIQEGDAKLDSTVNSRD